MIRPIETAMLRQERDFEFWLRIAHHPDVIGAVGGSMIGPEHMADLLGRPDVLPLAATHGGFIFKFMDGLGRVAELHTLFTPEGWGREVHAAAIDAFNLMFRAGAQLITTYELEANRRSRPPRTFGFVPIGAMEPSPFGPCTTWILTRPAWFASRPGRQTCH